MGQTEIFTHFPGDLLRKMNIFIINKQGDAQNLQGKMTLHFSLGFINHFDSISEIEGGYTQAEMQRDFAQEILRISLFIYYKNIHFAQEISWKMSKNFSLALGNEQLLN